MLIRVIDGKMSFFNVLLLLQVLHLVSTQPTNCGTRWAKTVFALLKINNVNRKMDVLTRKEDSNALFLSILIKQVDDLLNLNLKDINCRPRSDRKNGLIRKI